MQFFTVFIEFFLIGTISLGAFVPLLPSEYMKEVAAILFSSDVSKVYLIGVAYVVGVVFHFFSRVIFSPTEVKVMHKSIQEHYHLPIRQFFKEYSPVGLDVLNKPSDLRRLFRFLRQTVSSQSSSQAEFLKEQDQLLRVTRGIILPSFMTSVTLLLRYYIVSETIIFSLKPASLLWCSVIMFFLSVSSYFAFKKRTEDYHRNTLAAYLGLKLGSSKQYTALPKIKKYSTLVFDLDGTLMNSLPIHERSWRYALSQISPSAHKLQTDAIIRNLYDGLSGEQMFLGSKFDPAIQQTLRKLKDEIYLSQLNTVKPFEGIFSLLEELTSIYNLAIATTSSSKITNTLIKDHGLNLFFKAIITSDNIQSSKPDPSIMFHVSELTKTELSDILFIGDSLNDWYTSRLAGTDFIFANFDNKPIPEWASSISVVYSAEQLLELLTQR